MQRARSPHLVTLGAGVYIAARSVSLGAVGRKVDVVERAIRRGTVPVRSWRRRWHGTRRETTANDGCWYVRDLQSAPRDVITTRHAKNCRAAGHRTLVPDPARFPWREVAKVQHYYLTLDAMTGPMMVRGK